MTTTWVIRMEGDHLLLQDSADTFEQAVARAEKWVAERKSKGYIEGIIVSLDVFMERSVVKVWRLSHPSLIPITISISEWD